jgi:hypothetical protein
MAGAPSAPRLEFLFSRLGNAALQFRSPGHGDERRLVVVRAWGHVGDTHVWRP